MPANGGGGSFEFTTNIEQIRQTIVANLEQLASQTNSAMQEIGRTPNAGFLTGFQSDMQAFADRGLRQIEQVAAKFRDAFKTSFAGGAKFDLGALGGSFVPQAAQAFEEQFRQATSLASRAAADNPEMSGLIQKSLAQVGTQLREAIASFSAEIQSFAKTASVPPRVTAGAGLGKLDELVAVGNASIQEAVSGGASAEKGDTLVLTAEAVKKRDERIKADQDKALEALKGANNADVARGTSQNLVEQITNIQNTPGLSDEQKAVAIRRATENLAKQEAKVNDLVHANKEFDDAMGRRSTVLAQLGTGDAYTTRNQKYALSRTEGLVNLNSGKVVNDEAEIRRALIQLGGELQNVQLKSERAGRSLSQAFGEGFLGVGGSKYRGFGGAGQVLPTNPLIGFAETAGIVAKYELQGVTIFRIGEEAIETAKNFADLSEAQEQLASIMGEGTEISDGYTNTLQNLAVVAGESVVEALRAAQIGVAAFSTEAESKSQRLDTGAKFNSAAVQLGQISGMKLAHSAQSEVAIGTSFGLGIDELPRIANAVAVAFQQFGANRAETTDGLRQIAQAGEEAGYSLEQLGQVVGLIQARTAEGGTTISSSLGRIFSLAQGDPGHRLLSSIGIDTTTTVAAQLTELGARWAGLSQAQREAVLTTLGGERSLKELVPLLTQNAALQEAFSKSITDTGAAQRQQDAIINSVVGQLRILGQTLKNIGLDVARSGVLTPIGLLIGAIRPLLDLTDRLLQAYDRLPPAFKGVVASILEAVAAYKLLQTAVGQAAIGSVVGGAKGLLGLGKGARVGAEVAGAAGVVDVAKIFRLAGAGKVDEAMTLLTKGFTDAAKAATVAEDATLGAAAASRIRTTADLADATATGADTAAKVVDAAVTEGDAAAKGLNDLVPGLRGLRGSYFNPTEEQALRLGYVAPEAGVAAEGGLLAGAAAAAPIAGAVAALVAVAGTTDAWLHLSETAKSADKALGSLGGLGGGAGTDVAGSLQAAAITLGNQATKLDEQSHSFFGTVANFLSGNEFSDKSKAIQRQSEYAAQEAQKIIASQQAANNPGLAANTFFVAGRSVSESLKIMSDRGFTASQQIRALAGALGVLHASADFKGAKNPLIIGTGRSGIVGSDENAATLTSSIDAAITKKVQDILTQFPNRGVAAGKGGVSLVPNAALGGQGDFLKNLPQNLDNAKLTDAITAELTNLGKYNNGKKLSGADQTKIIAAAKTALAEQIKDLPPQIQDLIVEAAVGAAEGQLGKLDAASVPKLATGHNLQDFLNGSTNKGKTPTEGFLALLQNYQPEPFDASGGQDDYQHLSNVARLALQRAKEAGLDQTDAGDFQTLVSAAETATQKAIQTKVAHLEAIRKALDSRTTDLAKQANIDLRKQTQEVLAITRQSVNGKIDVADLVGVLNTMSSANQRKVKTILETAVKRTRDNLAAALRALADLNKEIALILQLPAGILNTDPTAAAANNAAIAQQNAAKAQIAKAQAAAKAAAAALGGFATAQSQSVPSDGSSTAETAAQIAAARAEAQAIPGNAVSQARAQLNAAEITLAAVKNHNSTEYWNAYKAVQDAKFGLAQAEAQQAAAQAQASAIPGDALSQARASVQAARDNLAAAAQGSADWWNAYKALKDAQYQVAEAERQHANNVRLLHIDLTDPVAVARAALADARAKLREDARRGADTSGDEVDVERKQAELAAARFSQKMQDEQTAYDLHRISGAAYLQFLERQDKSLRRQLATMKKGTEGYRQLLNELNQVDKAIQDLNQQLSGQFNLGNIDVPTPYDVRRYISTSRHPERGQVYNHNNTITINGADFDKVKQLILQLLGQNATSRLSVSTRKT